MRGCIHGNRPHPQVKEKLESLRKEVESLEVKVGVAKEQYQETVAAAQVPSDTCLILLH